MHSDCPETAGGAELVYDLAQVGELRSCSSHLSGEVRSIPLRTQSGSYNSLLAARLLVASDSRILLAGETRTCCTVSFTLPGSTGHARVSEFWYVLEGHGQIWRDDGDESCVVDLVPGTAIDIPVGTRFQYRNVSDVDLKFICVAMPPWPGDSEATHIEGPWQPTV